MYRKLGIPSGFPELTRERSSTMQCPVCGSDRKPDVDKCPTCGVDFSKWLNKIINRLHTKTNKIMQSAVKKKTQDDQPVRTRYKEVIKQD